MKWKGGSEQERERIPYFYIAKIFWSAAMRPKIDSQKLFFISGIKYFLFAFKRLYVCHQRIQD